MEEEKFYLTQRRLRVNRHIRELSAHVRLNHRNFIQPLFVDETLSSRSAIDNLHGMSSDTGTSVLQQIESDLKAGISKFLLFPIPGKKSDTDFDFQFISGVLQEIRRQFRNDVWIAADACLCAYTTHGHCGIVNKEKTKLLNHESVMALTRYALVLAEAGADCIAPSDMMDGRIKSIRQVLDNNDCDHVAVMSYSAKFSSNLYGPFRDVCKSAPGAGPGDRKTYQLSPFNMDQSVLATRRDILEGADIVMVKPALSYLDVISQLKNVIQQPLASYHVSGEYQSIELLAARNLLSREKGHVEAWTSLTRAGSDIIISYAAREAQKWIGQIEY